MAVELLLNETGSLGCRVNEINRIAHLNNIDIIVDDMSSYAGIVIDLRDDDFDYIISSSNKCIQGMPGIGFVICKK